MQANNSEEQYWKMTSAAVLRSLNSAPGGLTDADAANRLIKYGENTIKEKKQTTPLALLLSQFKNPIILIMIVATAISAATGNWLDSLVIFSIVLGSSVLSFYQEYSAGNAIEELRAKVQITSTVVRNETPIEIVSSTIVPGDIILLSAGSLIPADGYIIESQNLYVNQSVLTGESFPVEKRAGAMPENDSLAERDNYVFMGTSVHSGTATIAVVKTGAKTEFGQIARQLTLRPPETEFERGVRRFGYLLTELMLILTLAIFAINVLLSKPAIDSLLFSVALAVGITPQLLPAIINIALSKGSRVMAKEGVIVRRLNAIENFGSMDILCTDKTGTLTEGVVRLDGAVNIEGQKSESVFRLAYLNASLQKGLVNALDQAITADRDLEIAAVEKLGEIPYDFFRKRLSIIVREDKQHLMITKGALSNILSICSQVQLESNVEGLDAENLNSINELFAAWSDQGYRVLGVALKTIDLQERYSIEDERNMTFVGFLLFYDPPKTDVLQTVVDLAQHGVQLKIITGDNKLVARHIADTIGLSIQGVLTGAELSRLTDEALWNVVEKTTLFAEVEPNQKERIIIAFKKKNHVVGYLGDGINDAPALHAADVGISVNTAVDVAKDSADFVLMEHSLAVLKRGIELGRTTFANTLKYIFITTSANFGNMFSMAGASLFLPFLPLLPKQILLINFITDFPAMTISADAVDVEMIKVPRRWDLGFIRKFMFTFGLISSVFDYLTFAVLLILFKAPQALFQSGWFILSILTELMVLLVMRTQKPFFKSNPAPILLYSTIGVGFITMALPYLPLHNIISIYPIPPLVLLTLLGIAALYITVTEIAKHYFYRAVSNSNKIKA